MTAVGDSLYSRLPPGSFKVFTSSAQYLPEMTVKQDRRSLPKEYESTQSRYSERSSLSPVRDTFKRSESLRSSDKIRLKKNEISPVVESEGRMIETGNGKYLVVRSDRQNRSCPVHGLNKHKVESVPWKESNGTLTNTKVTTNKVEFKFGFQPLKKLDPQRVKTTPMLNRKYSKQYRNPRIETSSVKQQKPLSEDVRVNDRQASLPFLYPDPDYDEERESGWSGSGGSGGSEPSGESRDSDDNFRGSISRKLGSDSNRSRLRTGMIRLKKSNSVDWYTNKADYNTIIENNNNNNNNNSNNNNSIELNISEGDRDSEMFKKKVSKDLDKTDAVKKPAQYTEGKTSIIGNTPQMPRKTNNFRGSFKAIDPIKDSSKRRGRSKIEDIVDESGPKLYVKSRSTTSMVKGPGRFSLKLNSDYQNRKPLSSVFGSLERSSSGSNLTEKPLKEFYSASDIKESIRKMPESNILQRKPSLPTFPSRYTNSMTRHASDSTIKKKASDNLLMTSRKFSLSSLISPSGSKDPSRLSATVNKTTSLPSVSSAPRKTTSLPFMNSSLRKTTSQPSASVSPRKLFLTSTKDVPVSTSGPLTSTISTYTSMINSMTRKLSESLSSSSNSSSSKADSKPVTVKETDMNEDAGKIEVDNKQEVLIEEKVEETLPWPSILKTPGKRKSSMKHVEFLDNLSECEYEAREY